MRKTLLQSLKFIAFLAFGLIILWVAFRNTDFRRLGEELKDAEYGWIILSMIFGFLAYISRALRWNILILPLGYKPSAINTFHAVMTGYLANLALPRVGEITRCVALGKKEKIPVDQLFGTVLIERTVDFFSLMIIMAGVILTSSHKAVEFINESIFLPLREKLILVFGVTWILWATLLGLIIISLALLVKYKRNLRRIRFFAKIFDTARGVIHGLRTITNLERKWAFLAHTAFIWLNYALMTWVVVFSLDTTSGITLGESLFLLVIGGLAMSAPVQSGFGIFHYAVSRAIVILENGTLEDGLAYAILTHESQLILVALVGTISFFMMFRKNRKINPLNPTGNGVLQTEL